MSASTERKIRRTAREAGNDKKAIAAAEEAKKNAKINRRYTFAFIGVALFVIITLFLNSGYLYRGTTALEMGGKKYSPARVNYEYASAYNNFVASYGSYASIFGLDTTYGLAGLGTQPCSMTEEGGTWRDYFLKQSTENLKQLTVLNNYAAENGIELDENELSELEKSYTALEDQAKQYGYSNANKFLAANFGKGVNLGVAKEHDKMRAIASKAYSKYAEGLDITDQEIKENYAKQNGGFDLFEYAYFHVDAEKVEDKVTDETKAVAADKCEAIAKAYGESKNTDRTAALNEAVKSVVSDGEATVDKEKVGASLSAAYKDWLMDSARKAGDVTTLPDSGDVGSYVIVFLSRNSENFELSKTDITNTRMTEWVSGLSDALEVRQDFFYRIVGKV